MKSDRQMKGVEGGKSLGKEYICLLGRQEGRGRGGGDAGGLGGRKSNGNLNSSDQEEHRIFAL